MSVPLNPKDEHSHLSSGDSDFVLDWLHLAVIAGSPIEIHTVILQTQREHTSLVLIPDNDRDIRNAEYRLLSIHFQVGDFKTSRRHTLSQGKGSNIHYDEILYRFML